MDLPVTSRTLSEHTYNDVLRRRLHGGRRDAERLSRVRHGGPSALGAIDISSNGRMLLIDKGAPGLPLGGSLLVRGPVQVIDWITGNVESLTRAETYEETRDFICRLVLQPVPCTLPASSNGAQVSDDLQVVGTTTSTGAGWYEYSVAPPSPISSTSASPS